MDAQGRESVHVRVYVCVGAGHKGYRSKRAALLTGLVYSASARVP